MMVRDGPFIDGKSVQNGDLPSKNHINIPTMVDLPSKNGDFP